MPASLKFSPKRVKLTDINIKIMGLYQRALNEVFQKDMTFADDTAIVATKETSLPGWWAKFVSTVHTLTGAKLAANQERMLLPFLVTLDLPAYELYRVYRNYLNQLTSEYAKSGVFGELFSGPVQELTENEQIDKGYILLREILLRLAAVALSDDTQPTRDGDHLINVINKFTSYVLKERSLTSSKSFSELEKQLATTHKAQLIDITNTVQILKLLHSNREQITKALDFLNNVEIRLQAFLILLINPNEKSEAAASEGWVDTTLALVEKQCIEQKKQNDNLALVPINDLNDVQQQVINRLSAKTTAGVISVQEQVAALYQLLNKTCALKQLLGYIDALRVIAGWVPILCGGLDLTNVACAITMLGQECEQKTSFSGPKDPRLDTPIGRTIAHYNMKEPLSFTAIHIADGLTSLTAPERLKLIAEVGKQSIIGLIEVQKKLGITVLNMEKLQMAFPGYLPSAEKKLPAIMASVSNPKSSHEGTKPISAKTTTPFAHTASVASAVDVAPGKIDPEERIQAALVYMKDQLFLEGYNILKFLVDSVATLTLQQKAKCYYNLALLAFKEKVPELTLEQGFDYVKNAADSGHLQSKLLYAQALEEGKGCKKNLPAALNIYEQLHNAGHAQATSKYRELLLKVPASADLGL